MKTIILFFGPVWNSVKGKINLEELIRILILSITTSTSALGAMSFIYTHISEFVTDPMLITLISSIVGIVTFGVDYFRRKNQNVPVKGEVSNIQQS